MITNITISNILSVNEEVSLNFLASKEKRHLNHLFIHDKDTKVLKTKIIIGKNDTGKTNIIKTLSYLKQIYDQSLTVLPKDIYYKKPNNHQNSTKIELSFIEQNHHYQYGVIFNIYNKEIHEEYLYELKSKNKIKKFHFQRKEVEKEVFDEKISKAAKERLQAYLYDLRYDRKTLLITKMKDKYISDFKELEFFYHIISFFNKLIVYVDEETYHFKYFSYHQHHKIIQQLLKLQIPITQMKYEEVTLDYIRIELGRHKYDKWLEYISYLKHHQKTEEHIFLMFGYLYRVVFLNESDLKVYLTKVMIRDTQKYYHELSSGYKQIIMYLMLFTAKEETILVIDDFGLHTHPTTTKTLLQNNLPYHKQLILSTHNLLLLDNSLIRKDELCISTMTLNGAMFKRVDQFLIRNDKNLFNAYLDDIFK